MLKKFAFIFLVCLGASSTLIGQTFKAYITSGINASQIDGDFEVGFNKIGYTGGIGIGLNINDESFVSTEFLFSQRGSKNARLDKASNITGDIHFNYIELPILYRLSDWYQEDESYHKVWLEGGLSVARLIAVNFKFDDQPSFLDEIRTNDLSYILGGGLNVNKHIFVNVRYTRSFFPMYVAESASINDAQRYLSYFLTLRVGYTL